MTLETWLAFCATETVLCFTPGPAVLFVVSTALTQHARAGIQASLGILTANIFYFSLSATGIGALLAMSWQLFLVLKWGGAAYLIWLGLKMVFARSAGRQEDATAPVRPGGGRPFFNAMIVQGANPKAIVFFTALLSQFINPHASVAWQVLILGASSFFIELAVLSLYVLICHRARQFVKNPRYALPLERLGGVLLIAAGARLAAVKSA